MTALITRTDPATATDYVDEDDGCPAGHHWRDALCARTRLETLPPLPELTEPRGAAPADERGGAT
ncbi:hypothetical protein ACFFX1_54895 [Dactylosporangium sucinum]|uniref:Uncharacterized protein n=1 Tax=Dactylosporangium sucinum TaxID=1424081 RepID=A0A917X1T2_9ACTN|nr:hypothetical protein [Dactylosporangium sucinum]GGM53454.1 hypothetical protein GCM10007977_063800 [Dactylosporangium sucinum]